MRLTELLRKTALPLFFTFLLTLLVFGIRTSSAGFFGWKVFDTEYARVFYKPGYENLAIYTAEIFAAYRDKVINLVGNDPGKVNIVLVDFGAYWQGIGFYPTNTEYVFLWPSAEEDFIFLAQNYRDLIVHEFTHICDGKRERGLPAFLDRVIFGMPQVLGYWFRSPFTESTTTFSEAYFSPYNGRPNNPFTSYGLFASLIKTNSMPSNFADIFSFSDDAPLPSGAHYLIPSGFYRYLSQTYGHDKVKLFLKEYSGKFMGIGINSASKKAFGKDMETLYKEFLAYLKKLSKNYHNQGKELFSEKGLFVVQFIPEGLNGGFYFIAGRKSPYNILTGEGEIFLGKVDKNGNWKILKSINIPTISHPKRVGEYLYFLTFENKLHRSGDINLVNLANLYYIEASIKRINLKTFKQEKLVSGKILSYDVSENGTIFIAFYDVKKRKSSIYRGSFSQQLFTIDGIVRELRVSPDGKLALLVDEEDLNLRKIYIYKNGKLYLLLNDPFLKHSLFWKDENTLLFSASYTKRYLNIYELNVETGKLYRLTENSVFIKPLICNGELYALGYSEKVPGFTIYKVSAKPKEFKIPPASPVPIERKKITMKEANGDLAYLKTLALPMFRVPLFLPGEEGFALGLFSYHLAVDWKTQVALLPLFYHQEDGNWNFMGKVYLMRMLPANFILSGYYQKFDKDFVSDPEDEEAWKISLSKPLFIWYPALDKKIYLSGSVSVGEETKDFEITPGLSLTAFLGETRHFFGIENTFSENDTSLSMSESTLLGLYRKFALSFGFEGEYEFEKEEFSDYDTRLGLRFFLKKIKKGIANPYFYFNNLYFSPVVGYDEDGAYGGAYLGVDFANFVIPAVWNEIKVG